MPPMKDAPAKLARAQAARQAGMGIAATAKEAGVSISHIQRWIQSGALRHPTVAESYHFKPARPEVVDRIMELLNENMEVW